MPALVDADPAHGEESSSPIGDWVIGVVGLGRGHLGFGPSVDCWLAPLAGDRDVVVFDQRGTGCSQPELSCPEVVEAQLEMSDANRVEGFGIWGEAPPVG